MTWPTVELGEVLSYRKEFVTIEPDVTYSRCRVQTSARGVVLRDRVVGSDIKTKKQQLCRAGDFLVAEIDAKLGGYGFVPGNLEGAIVSSHYFLYAIDESKIDQKFFEWFSRTKEFLEQVNARGSTNYAAVRPTDVLAYRLPLPTLAEQRQIVARLDRVAALVEERRQTLEAAERDADALLRKAFDVAIDGAEYKPMQEVAPLVRRPVDVQPDESYPEMGVRSFGRGTFHKPPLEGSQLTWQKLFRVHEGDLVFSNIKAWEGAFAVAEPEDDGRVGNHRYLTCVPTPGVATSRFISYYLRTREGADKIEAASPGSADRNRTLGQKALAAITAPMPTIEQQMWFNALQEKAQEIRQVRAATAEDIDSLIPAMLHDVFGSWSRSNTDRNDDSLGTDRDNTVIKLRGTRQTAATQVRGRARLRDARA